MLRKKNKWQLGHKLTSGKVTDEKESHKALKYFYLEYLKVKWSNTIKK